MNRISVFLLSTGVALTTLACAWPADEPAANPEGGSVDGKAESVAALTLEPLAESPQYADAKLTLDSYDPASGAFDFEVEGYELGVQTADAADKGIANSAQGQHIHLIVDNGPYSAHYVDDFEAPLGPGRHVVLAFLSRSYHESVKSPGAAVLTTLGEGDGGEGDGIEFDAEAPHLFYSRPKGTYVGADIDELMLDFYLVNADLSADGYHVRATINGQEFLVDTWQPYVIRGLTPGEVTVELKLLDGEGNTVPGPFNQVTRKVILEAGE